MRLIVANHNQNKLFINYQSGHIYIVSGVSIIIWVFQSSVSSISYAQVLWSDFDPTWSQSWPESCKIRVIINPNPSPQILTRSGDHGQRGPELAYNLSSNARTQQAALKPVTCHHSYYIKYV